MFRDTVEDFLIRMNFDVPWTVLCLWASRRQNRANMGEFASFSISSVHFDRVCSKNRDESVGVREFDTMRTISLWEKINEPKPKFGNRLTSAARVLSAFASSWGGTKSTS